LEVAGGRLLCISGTTAERAIACPLGALEDDAAHACIPVSTLTANGKLVDVGRWMRAAFGHAGGRGSRPFCDRLARDPALSLGELATATRAIEIAIRLTLPNNDVREASHVTTIEITPHENPRATATTAAEVDLAVSALVDALRALGGSAATA